MAKKRQCDSCSGQASSGGRSCKDSKVLIEVLDRFSAIYERDIDLLLMEEFNCNPSFCGWFSSKLELSSSCPVPSTCTARHSVASTTEEAVGESDLEIVFEFDTPSGRKSVLVLLEDKVTARFTPDQAARYRSRAKDLADRKGIDEYCTVLLAPKAYLVGLDCFDKQVPYEDVRDFFESQAANASPDIAARYRHRAAILRHAIEKHRRGGTRANDKTRTQFFDAYYELAVKCDRKLKQKPARPRSQQCVGFFYDLTPRCDGVKDLFLEHKLKKGCVGIEFRGWGEHQNWYVPRLCKVAEDDMVVKPLTAHTICVRIFDLPELDLDRPLCEQEADARRGIEASARLLAWYKKHVKDFDAWTAKLLSKESD